MTATTVSFFRGIPTAPDVKRLDDAYGSLSVGQKLQWGELASVVGESPGTYRFRTIVTQWRRKLDRDRNIIMGAVRGEGLEVLDGHGRAVHVGVGFKSGMRKSGRAASVACRTDLTTLDAPDRRVVEHVNNTVAAIRLVAATKAKELPPI